MQDQLVFACRKLIDYSSQSGDFCHVNFVVFALQNELSLRFELTGGFIKNAVLSALSIAVSREGDNPVVCQGDLLQGANLQLRGRLKMKVSILMNNFI